MDQLKVELKMLEQNDGSVASIWKKKCLDMFEVCQSMKQENDELRDRCKDLIDQGIALSDLQFGVNLKSGQGLLPELLQQNHTHIPTSSFTNFQTNTKGISGQLSKLRQSFTSGADNKMKDVNSYDNLRQSNSNLRPEMSNKIWELKTNEKQTRNTSFAAQSQ